MKKLYFDIVHHIKNGKYADVIKNNIDLFSTILLKQKDWLTTRNFHVELLKNDEFLKKNKNTTIKIVERFFENLLKNKIILEKKMMRVKSKIYHLHLNNAQNINLTKL